MPTDMAKKDRVDSDRLLVLADTLEDLLEQIRLNLAAEQESDGSGEEPDRHGRAPEVFRRSDDRSPQ